MRARWLMIAALAGGCASAQQTAEDVAGRVSDELDLGPTARAQLLNPQGAPVGTVVLQQNTNSVEVDIEVTALPPGVHGVHFHAVGACAAPDFASAGAHFNPAQRQHGFDNPQGVHNGDLRNLEVGANGRVTVEMNTDRVTLREGPTSLLDADGTAIVIHAAPDDYRTDPSGNSGARIACGVIHRQ